MSNMLTILRRDLGAFFTSPIGYIYMIVFVTITVGMFITSFFANPVAEMWPFFQNLPLMFCIIIPAITMRIWAEERKENTWEMLLTFPMKAWQLVIGKFLAALAFIAITLCATATLPITLMSLGNPDLGTMFAGYLGTILLGAFFLSIGIFFSGFFKDQILAFVVTLMTCFAVYLVGTTVIAAFIDDAVEGLGTMLSDFVGLSDHYAAFTYGVIEVADILYFSVWICIFLMLNIIYIDSRSRAGARLLFSATVAMGLGIGFLANWLIADTSLGRFDMTEDKIFTVSEASINVLSNVDTPVQIKVYITPRRDMPTQMSSLERDITNKLDELRIASGGKLEYKVVNLEVSEVIASTQVGVEDPEGEDMGEEAVLERRLLDKGVEPFSVQAISESQVTSVLVYSTIGIAYKDKKEELIPRFVPANLLDLEYRLVSTIYKLTRDRDPVVALVAPKEATTMSPQERQLYKQMGEEVPESEDPYDILEQFLDYEKYEVSRVDLTAESGLPAEYDTLVIVNPRSFSERQRWEVARALRAGKSVVMAVQNYEWIYQLPNVNRREETPMVNELLKEYGLGVDEDILMDINFAALNVQTGGGSSPMARSQPVDLPTHILLNNNSMNPNTSITSRLSTIFYLWGTALNLDEAKLAENGLEVTTLMSTTKEAWKWPKNEPFTPAAIQKPAVTEGPYPLMAMITGQFPDPFEGQERPAWPVPEPEPGEDPPPPPAVEEPAAEITPAPGKLILIGCSEMFRKNFLQASNLDLFLNSVDGVTLGGDLVNIRGRKPVARTIDTPSAQTRQFWKIINYTLASSIIALTGILVAVVRRRSRDAYTAQFVADNR